MFLFLLLLSYFFIFYFLYFSDSSFQQTHSLLELLCLLYMIVFLEYITLIEGPRSKIHISFY
jgi:hypothetical protein